MDPERFDRLTTQLAPGVSRRGILRPLGSGLIAAVIGHGAARQGVTRGRRRSKRRDKSAQVARREKTVQVAKKLPHGRRCKLRSPGKCRTRACAVVDPAKGDPTQCGVKKVGAPSCCWSEGKPCTQHCDCCGAMLCTNGVCGEVCTAIGEQCGLGTNCCQPTGGCGPITRFKADGSVCGLPGTEDADVCCVLNNGAVCADSCQCCGPSVCTGGQCVDPDGPPPTDCVDLQEVCDAGHVCCGMLEGPAVACRSIDPTKGRSQCPTAGGHTRCCLREDYPCRQDCDCCGALRCQDGACAPPPAVCHPLVETCDDGEPCCPGAGSCHGGRCCLPDTASCSLICQSGADCAACCASTCRSDGRCGPPQGCVEWNGICTTSEECCNNVDCILSSDGLGHCRFD